MHPAKSSIAPAAAAAKARPAGRPRQLQGHGLPAQGAREGAGQVADDQGHDAPVLHQHPVADGGALGRRALRALPLRQRFHRDAAVGAFGDHVAGTVLFDHARRPGQRVCRHGLGPGARRRRAGVRTADRPQGGGRGVQAEAREAVIGGDSSREFR